MDETNVEQPEIQIKKQRGRPAVRKEGNDYIDNKAFAIAMEEWINEIRKIKDKKKRPVLPNFVGECFMKIVANYANKHKFRGYTYIDEMRSEALLACTKYAHNYNPDRSSNAFSYFTQIAHNSFLQILKKEKKQNDVKNKKISEQSIYCYDNINLHKPEEEDI